MADSLREYRQKRDFRKTAEPSGDITRRTAGGHRYLIQKHAATRLHFDFRLELDGVLLSWAVPNGPSLNPKDKRLAVRTEDHPLDYGDFEGTIPKGEYGGGTVMLWDEGTWEPVGDPEAALQKGDFKFILHGERLKGKWVLVRMRRKPGERSKHENWLLIKERDEYATEELKPIVERVTSSVRTGRTIDQIAAGNVEWLKSGMNIRKDDPAPAKEKRTRRTAEGSPPKFVEPQLATLVDAPPAGDEWVHEIKYDGYRVLASVGGGGSASFTRRGLDWTDKFARSLVGGGRASVRCLGADRRRGGGRRTRTAARVSARSRIPSRGAGGGSATTCSTSCSSTARISANCPFSNGRQSSLRFSPISRGPDRCSIRTTSSATAPRCLSTSARSTSRASSRSAPTPPIVPTAPRPGSRRNAASGRSSSSSAGGPRTLRRGRSRRSCSPSARVTV